MKLEYPVEPIVLPPEMKNQSNGKIAPILLHDIPGGGKLEAYTYWYWTVLQQECAKAGVTLTYTGTYRTYQQQEALFLSRYTTEHVSNNMKRWNGTAYYLRPHMAEAAIPGTSNHGMGIAIDMALNGYSNNAVSIDQHGLDVVKYIIAAHDLGFSWEGDPQSDLFEPWHIRHYRPS